jgi:hypothetical protein
MVIFVFSCICCRIYMIFLQPNGIYENTNSIPEIVIF